MSLIRLEVVFTEVIGRRPFLLVSAGFSAEAEKHLEETFKPLERDYNIIRVIYRNRKGEFEAKLHQDDAVKRKDMPREYDLYKSLGSMVGEQLKHCGIGNVHVIAKSAGAAVLINLPQYIKIESISLLAPAPIRIDTFGIPLRQMPLMLGWSVNDPKIPHNPYCRVMEGFLSAHGYTVQHAKYDKKTHDFTPEFIADSVGFLRKFH
jgi:hypothetical protein